MGKILGFSQVLEYERTHPTISKMLVGEVAYDVPWMVRMLKDGTVYIQDTEVDTTETKPHGTATLKITRVSEAKDGYELDFSSVQDSITVVEKESNLSDGIICPRPFIKIGKIQNSEVVT